MHTGKLGTCQYAGAELTRQQGISGTKATGQHTVRILTAVAAAGLAAWFGCGSAHADSSREREACALMDDYATSMNVGLAPLDYAMRVLSKEISPVDAAPVVAAAAHDDCPKRLADLPPGWI